MTAETNERREQLLALRATLTGAIRHLHRDAAGGDEMNTAYGDQHPADHATELVDREMEEALEGSADHVVRAVDEALARIEAGTYGICDVCGHPIPDERLAAVPYATLCIEHERAAEKQ
jgi:DnaK suppressor protein